MKRDPVCKMEVNEDEAVTTEYGSETIYFCSEGCKDAFLKEKASKPPRRYCNLIIIGGGPAGLTAGVYAASLQIDTFLITKDLGGQAIDSTKIKNYMGYDFITGPELIEKFKYQLIHSHYIAHLMSEVEKIEPVEGGFKVTTAELKEYFAKTLIIATGMTRRKLNVQGENKFQRKGIFYGHIQDCFFVQGKDVAVIGGGNSALQIAENLHAVAKGIHLISDAVLTADPLTIKRISKFENLKKYEGYKILEFIGRGTLDRIIIRKKGQDEITKIPVKGTFIAIGLRPSSSLVSGIVDLNKKGEVIINSDCSTSFPGIFAAGDITNAFGKRIIIASGEGAKAAITVRQYLLNL